MKVTFDDRAYSTSDGRPFEGEVETETQEIAWRVVSAIKAKLSPKVKDITEVIVVRFLRDGGRWSHPSEARISLKAVLAYYVYGHTFKLEVMGTDYGYDLYAFDDPAEIAEDFVIKILAMLKFFQESETKAMLQYDEILQSQRDLQPLPAPA